MIFALKSSTIAVLIIGVLLLLAGVTFSLQGMGIVGPSQSFMYNSNNWILYGSITAVVGIVLVMFSLYLFAMQRRKQQVSEPAVSGAEKPSSVSNKDSKTP